MGIAKLNPSCKAKAAANSSGFLFMAYAAYLLRC